MSLTVEPGMVVVRNQRKIKADFFSPARIFNQVVRRVFLA
jgi:hypothetical protein